MIQKGSVLNVLDNSGVKTVKCLNTVGSKSHIASIGSVINTVVCSTSTKTVGTSRSRKASLGESVKRRGKKKAKLHAVVVQTAAEETREDGSKIRYGQNAVVLVWIPEGKLHTGNPIGTRVLQPVSESLRYRIQVPGLGVKILSLAKGVY